jgi:hypothetical protein
VHEQELLAIIVALKHWRHHLYGQPFNVVTDHHSLQHLHTQPHLSARQARWLEFLQEFHFTITYQPGKTNSVADALSRETEESRSVSLELTRHDQRLPLPLIKCTRTATPSALAASYRPAAPYCTLAAASTHTTSRPHSKELIARITAGYGTDPLLAPLLTTPLPEDSPFEVQDGVLWRAGKICVPNDRILRTTLLTECHDVPISGHLGVAKTMKLLSRNFYWKDMLKDVQSYVATCVECQVNKNRNTLPAGLLQPLPIPARRWEMVSLDLITQLPRTERGKDAIVVFVDKLSKMVHFAATTTTVTAPELAIIFFQEIVRHHGIPSSLVSDRDTRFTSHFWKELWSLLGTKLRMSTSYHPQSDGQTERTNRTLEQVLRAYVNARLNDWDLHLVGAEIAINNSSQESTGFTPFYLNSGQHPLLPLSQAIGTAAQHNSKVPAVTEMLKQMHADLTIAQQSLQRAQQSQAKAANRYRRDEVWKVNDEALLSTDNLTKQNHKLLSRYIGPFRVTQVISPVAVKLELPRRMKIHNSFHISKLKHFHSNHTEFPGRDQDEMKRPGPVLLEEKTGREYWEVERIMGKRLVGGKRKKKIQFLVLWKGWPRADATWEDEREVRQAAEEIEKYEERERRRNEEEEEDASSEEDLEGEDSILE